MKTSSNLTLSTSPPTRPARKPRLTARSLYRSTRRRYTGKEQDSETGLHYYGARYLDSRTGRWLSGDPALGDYVPQAPVNEEAKKQNGSLPGMGGVFNYANLHVYHYAGNNPVKYTDPDGKSPRYTLSTGLTPNPEDPLSFCSGGGGATLLYIGAGLATASTILLKNRNPFPEDMHIPPGNRPQSPMGKGANADPMDLPQGPNFENPKGGGPGAFAVVALATLSQIWDNITGASSQNPPVPSDNKQTENKTERRHSPSTSTPSFIPDYNSSPTEYTLE